ncbi:MAG: T9SS type A sorting domain-containing protein [Saprospiraceae bacterium]
MYWETATETQNDFFTIERSFDGLTWDAIHEVEGAKYSTTLQKYSYLDIPKSSSEVIYYRLRQTDLDGTETVSHILVVKLDNKNTSLLAFPNPTNHQVQITGADEFENWTLVNAQGINVYEKIRVISNEKGSLHLDLNDLTKGYYFFQCQGRYQTIVKL